MKTSELIDKLNGDLANEYAHLHFYLQASAIVCGINRLEVSEWFAEHALGEFKHIQEFSKVIVGLGGIPTTKVSEFKLKPVLPDHPMSLMQCAKELESQVVENYVLRISELQEMELNTIDKKYVELFLEEQILDSRGDLDEINQFLKSATL